MFEAKGLAPALFSPLFDLSDDALLAVGARRLVADAPDAYPCRVSLARAAPGEELLLVHFAHCEAPASPYRASGPIFVSRAGQGSFRDELPPLLRDRLVALKAYDGEAFIVDAEVTEGSAAAEDQIRRYLERPEVAHVDAHFARRGCFAARFTRVG